VNFYHLVCSGWPLVERSVKVTDIECWQWFWLLLIAGTLKERTAERDVVQRQLEDCENQLMKTNADLSNSASSFRQQISELKTQLDKVCFVIYIYILLLLTFGWWSRMVITLFITSMTYSVLSPVSTGMGDCQWGGIPHQNVTKPAISVRLTSFRIW